MRSRWYKSIAITGVAMVLIGACTGDGDSETTEPPATREHTATNEPTSPITAPTQQPTQDEEPDAEDVAFEAASDALVEYHERADAAYANPPDDLDALEDVAYGPALDQLRAGVQDAQTDGWRRTGESVVSAFELVKSDLNPKQPENGVAYPSITIRACHDISDTDTLDENGKSLISPDRPDQYYMQYQLLDVGFPDAPGQWRVLTEDPQLTDDDPPEAKPCP